MSQALERLLEYPTTCRLGIPVEDFQKHAVWPLCSLPEKAAHVIFLVFSTSLLELPEDRMLNNAICPHHPGNISRVQSSI